MYSGVPQHVHRRDPACVTRAKLSKIKQIRNIQMATEKIPKISQLGIAVAIEQQILGFDVAINDLALMQEVNGLNCTRHIELSPILWELLVFFQMRPEFTAETGLLYNEFF